MGTLTNETIERPDSTTTAGAGACSNLARARSNLARAHAATLARACSNLETRKQACVCCNNTSQTALSSIMPSCPPPPAHAHTRIHTCVRRHAPRLLRQAGRRRPHPAGHARQRRGHAGRQDGALVRCCSPGMACMRAVQHLRARVHACVRACVSAASPACWPARRCMATCCMQQRIGTQCLLRVGCASAAAGWWLGLLTAFAAHAHAVLNPSHRPGAAVLSAGAYVRPRVS